MVHAAAAPRWFSYRWDSFLLLTTVGHTEVFLRHVLHRAEQPLRCLLVHLKVGDRAAALAPVAREAARDVALNAHARLIYVTRVIARGRGRVWARVPISIDRARRVGDDEQPARVVLRVGLEEFDPQRLDGLGGKGRKGVSK